MRALVICAALILSGCAQNQFGLGVDLGTGQVSPSFSGSSGNASISVGG